MKSTILDQKSMSTDMASLLLRIMLGGLFVTHGYSKIMSYDSLLSGFPDLIGIGSALSLHLVIFAEFFCAIFVVFGFLTRLSVIPIAITMFVAFFIAHSDDPFGRKELPFVYLCLTVILFVLGSGKWSVDRFLF